MNISSTSLYSSPASTAIHSGVLKRAQGISEVAQRINDITISAAAKRKELAVERLEGLQERLKVMMMFATLGSKGNAKAAAQIAKEIASAVKDYSSASGKDPNASAEGMSKQDDEFLNTAKRLAAQVKAIITFEAARAKQKEKHQKETNQMDTAISNAEMSLRHNPMSGLYASDGQLALLMSHFSASA